MQARILWSLLWRSILWFPLGVLMCSAVVAYPCLMVLLPVSAGVFFIGGSWVCGLVSIAVMVPVFALRHWFVSRLMNDHGPCGFL